MRDSQPSRSADLLPGGRGNGYAANLSPLPAVSGRPAVKSTRSQLRWGVRDWGPGVCRRRDGISGRSGSTSSCSRQVIDRDVPLGSRPGGLPRLSSFSPARGLLIVEGNERLLRPWDFVCCRVGAKHMIVGAVEVPCTVLGVGAQRARDRSERMTLSTASPESHPRHGGSVNARSYAARS